MDYTKLADEQLLNKMEAALKTNGFLTHIVENGSEAKSKVESLLTEGSSVMQMTSVTLDSTGISELINESGKYSASKTKLYAPDTNLSWEEKQSLGYAADFAVGSLHAITKSGELVIASNTGSQLGAHAYGAKKVIFVVGTQKLVDGDLNSALKRIYEHVLPLESERAKKAYGMPGSNVSKILIINKEIVPERIHIILVKENLGY